MPNITLSKQPPVSNSDRLLTFSHITSRARASIWAVGIPSWMFGITDRSFAAVADGCISAIELTHLFTALFFFISWIFLKPENLLNIGQLKVVPYSYQFNPVFQQASGILETARLRMLELRQHHLISQEYILPVPYLCQIYHLLNLKHLESVHSISLGNLKVVDVGDFQSTEIGGSLKFRTSLESPLSVLRVWRQPIVEVDLTLHNPYTVELSIPVYGDKRITVMFNTFPISETEHKFMIDIYSNLGWYKPILQFVLHLAACLTLFEDLPYLQKLADRNLHRLMKLGKTSNHETMQLLNRFVDLYGANVEVLQGAIAPQI